MFLLLKSNLSLNSTAAPPWQPQPSISFQKVLKERTKENPVHKKAGMGAHPQEVQGK